MALSQKHVGKSVVPWFCSVEWNFVYEKIYGAGSNEKTKREALEILNIWKARTPLLQRGVEGTFIILEAVQLNRKSYDLYNLQLLLSTSIIRFLNICASYDKNQGTFYQTAHKMKLPEWLISLRHDIAHGQTLPSIDILDRALTYCLEWLYFEYWKPVSSEIKDFIDNTQFKSDRYGNLKIKLQPLVSHYCYITLLMHPNWNFKEIDDIVDKESMETFLEELTLVTGANDINKNTLFIDILQCLSQSIEQILKSFDTVENKNHALPELLLEEDIFLGNFDEFNEIFQDSQTIPESFLQIWEKLLVNMQKLNMIDPLIEKLLELLNTDNETSDRKTVAAMWLLEIGRGFSKCIIANDLIKSLLEKGTMQKYEVNMKVKELLQEKYENISVINFNYIYNYTIPEVFSDCSKFKSLVLDKPNNYTKVFISEFLDLNEILKRRENKEEVLDLLNLYISNGNDKNVVPSKVHNVEELINLSMEVDDESRSEANPVNIEEKIPVEHTPSEGFHTNKRWRKVTEFNFERHAIGILPWQSSSMNPLLL